MKTVNFMKTGLLALMMSLFLSACANETPQVKTETDQAEIDLQTAVITNNLEAIRQHIAAGTDLNQKDPFSGSSPLITAATFNKPEAAKLLIEGGAKLNIKNNDGSTALHSAAFFGRVEIVQLLLDAKADKSIKNNYQQTARESLMAPFEEIKPVYTMLQKQLAPMGLNLDLEEIEKARPVIRMMLQ